MLLQHSERFSQTKDFGKKTIDQMLIICVDYNPEDYSFSPEFAHLYENGRFLADILNLLDKFTGKPLDAILGVINWAEIHYDKITDSGKESIISSPDPIDAIIEKFHEDVKRICCPALI